jgi:nucleoid-associated protein YgaU
MANQFSPDSRYIRAPTIVDDGNIRPGRQTVWVPGHTPVLYEPRFDTRLHVIRSGELLDDIAMAYYRNPKLWWVIADFQPSSEIPILMPIEPLKVGQVLHIPSMDFVRERVLVQEIS